MKAFYRIVACLGMSVFGACANTKTINVRQQTSSGAAGKRTLDVIESIRFATRNYVKSKDAQGNVINRHAGSAFVFYYSDRRMEGSHLSGDPPFVHQDKSRLGEDAFSELWQAAEAVSSMNLPFNSRTDPDWTSYQELTIRGTNESKESIHIVWQRAEQLAPEVKRLLEVVLKHHIGGW